MRVGVGAPESELVAFFATPSRYSAKMGAHMRRRDFPNCEYGPFQLRRLIRARFLPGERVIGWAPALVNPPLWLMIAAAGLIALPGVGHLLLGVVLSSHRRMVVLTDSRLLVLTRLAVAGDPSGRGVKLDTPLHGVSILRTRSAHRFRITPRGRARPETFSIETRTSAGERLVAGLAMVADTAP